MAASSSSSSAACCSLLFTAALVLALSHAAHAAGLSPSFYDDSCSTTRDIVRRVVQDARVADERIPASLIRLHFHDCFVNVSSQNQLIMLIDSTLRCMHHLIGLARTL